MLMPHYKKAGQRQSIKIANLSFEDMAKFKYLGTILTDQNCMHEEINSRLNSGNACYQLVQSLLSSHLLSRNVPVVLCGCNTWSFAIREEHRLSVFENRILRTFGSRRDEVSIVSAYGLNDRAIEVEVEKIGMLSEF
jgi:hypothetical protein